MHAEKVYGALVLGAGINGLATLYHLKARGVSPLGLVEQFSLGHDRGSSHGHSRITRSAYINEHYVRLMQIAHGQEWPRLESTFGKRFVHPTVGCFYGPPGSKYDNYLTAVSRVGVAVEEISLEEARKRFPAFRFANAQGVLVDHTAGLVAAAATVQSLSEYARQHAEVHDNVRVQSIDVTQQPISVVTSRGTLSTERLVVTAGPWATRLLPFLRARLRVARQTVGYFKLQGAREAYQLGQFPVWSCLGGKDSEGHYGLPEFVQEGIKVAHHITRGRDDDPDQLPEHIEATALEELRRFIAEHFTAPLERCVHAEFCHYTNTASEDFILDLHPENEAVVIGAGFSGHGFKLGPVTGRILAELVLDGKTGLPEFEAARGQFAIQQG